MPDKHTSTIFIAAALVAIIIFCSMMLIAKSHGASLSCAVVGDSISADLARYFPECRVDAKSGIPSSQIISRVPSDVDVVIISSGSNDADNPGLENNLRKARARNVKAKFIWIIPVDRRASSAVIKISFENKRDWSIPFIPRNNDIHPANYKALAEAIRGVM